MLTQVHSRVTATPIKLFSSPKTSLRASCSASFPPPSPARLAAAILPSIFEFVCVKPSPMGFGLGGQGNILSVLSDDLGPWFLKKKKKKRCSFNFTFIVPRENARVTNTTTDAFIRMHAEYKALFSAWGNLTGRDGALPCKDSHVHNQSTACTLGSSWGPGKEWK